MKGYSKAQSARRGKTWNLKKGNKYNAKKTKYGGKTYDSKGEAKYRAKLDLLRKAKNKSERVTEIRDQYPVDVKLFGQHLLTHKVDFLVTYADGRKELHEYKGFETREWQIIRKLIEILLPLGKLGNTEPDWIYKVIR